MGDSRGNCIWRKMAKTPGKLKFTGYGRSYYIYSTIARNHEEPTTTVTSTEDCQTQTHFDRVSSPGSSADTQISLTGSDRAISRSPQEKTESKRLDYCSRCYEGKHNVKASGIYIKNFTLACSPLATMCKFKFAWEDAKRTPSNDWKLGLGLTTLVTLL